MHSFKASFVTAAVLATLPPLYGTADAQPTGGIVVRVDPLKRAVSEGPSDGPVFVGPQSAFELEWRVQNNTGRTLDLPSPDAVLRLRVANQGGRIPVRTEWAPEMELRSTLNGSLISTKALLGATALTDGSALWIRGSTTRADGSAFAPGDYVLELDATGVGQVDRGFPIQARILELNSPERQREFHSIEGTFYRDTDKKRALDHYAALVSLPGAKWTDSLGLAWIYGDLGMHRDASRVYRRILPDLIRALDGPLGKTFRNAGHLRRAATSFAVDGDVAGAANLLRIEGRTPEARIPAEIEQLKKSAPKPGDPKE